MQSNQLIQRLQPGVAAALGSAVLFGAGAPLAKGLLEALSPWMLAGLLYLGSGVGLAIYRLIKTGREALRWPQPSFAAVVLHQCC